MTTLLLNKRRAAALVLAAGLVLTMNGTGGAAGPSPENVKNKVAKVQEYTCAMHPNIRVSAADYAKGVTTCPICHMHLIPVRETGPAEAAPPQDRVSPRTFSTLTVPAGEIERAGVQTEILKKRPLFKTIRAVGTVAYDPDLAVAQEGLAAAMASWRKAQGSLFPDIKQQADDLVHAAEVRLKLLGLSPAQIEALKERPSMGEDLLLPGKTAWVYGEAYEYEWPWIKPGATVTVTSDGVPGRSWKGKIISVNPVLDAKTRTVRFRTEIRNPGEALRPNMYVDVLLQSHYTAPDGAVTVLAVPKEAVLDTGTREVVWVQAGPGRFEGRAVTLGPLCAGEEGARDYYPVLSGLTPGEAVVTEGNFLIDSQSRMTGVASSAYGGAIGQNGEKKAKPMSMPMGGM
jgi:Cu(I)/Ag(I) efflux system membrane fusion protein